MTAGDQLETVKLLLQATPEQWAAVRLFLAGPETGARPSGEPCGFCHGQSAVRVSAGAAYQLRRQLGLWRVVFEGRESLIEDCRGIALAAYLLMHPPTEPMHAVVLEAKVAGHDGGALGAVLAEGADGAGWVGVNRDGVVQERSGRRLTQGNDVILKRKLAELKQAMDDGMLPEGEREAAREEYGELLRASSRGGKLADSASRAADRVGKALRRLHRDLAGATSPSGEADAVLRAFGDHLHRHVLVPSTRYAGPRGRRSGARAGGCFTYERPAHVSWAD